VTQMPVEERGQVRPLGDDRPVRVDRADQLRARNTPDCRWWNAAAGYTPESAYSPSSTSRREQK
jgi:hypothetical protein